MKKVLVWGGGAVLTFFLVVGAAFAWASHSAGAKLATVFETHEADFPVPMPLSAEEWTELQVGSGGEGTGEEGADPEENAAPMEVDREALALERAIERGRHLIRARYACADCHGENMGGGVMVDDPAMGSLLGPNLTTGEGSITRDYSVADWDRIVRHGIKKDGTPALMPSEDFIAMSDRELSDLIAYIRSLPPVDNEVPPSTLGPVGKVLVATGKFPLSVFLIGSHDKAHLVEPPQTAETVEFGAHLARVCTGCHRQDLRGGPIVQGPPDWAQASDLTMTAQSGYDFVSFDRVMREGIRADGQPVQVPMNIATTFAANMTETEMKALWIYLESLSFVAGAD